MKKSFAVLCVLALPLVSVSAFAASAPSASHTFVAANGQFLLDGKPFRIISGEVHYSRIPRDQWRQTFRMARAMGLNTITTYVFWNVHEPRPGVYDFSGNADVAEFVREAQQEGLFVILRPGPYSCAEWDFGGFPSWLLKDKTMALRTTDPRFMQPVKSWLNRLGKELAPLQVGNGGPIVLVQVENEYGSYGSDKNYMRAVRSALIDAGFNKAVLYQCDGPEEMPNDALGDMPIGANFGPGEAQTGIARYKKFNLQGPYIVSEYWDGWFDHWGAPWLKTNAKQQAADVEYILTHNSSISLYMFRGGTSFGFMNGANSPHAGDYEPDVTSYDYDSALDESGHATPKYFLFRDAIERATGVKPPPVPDVPKLQALPDAKFTASTSLWDNLPTPVHSEHPLTMEDLNQAFGYILYRTTLKAPVSGTLDLGIMHQYAQVFVDGKLQGTADRRMQQHTVAIASTKPGAQLDILIENTGRINFGPRILGERVGLLTDASINGSVLTAWSIYTLPLDNPAKLHFSKAVCTGPCFYRATLQVAKPVDTYLDTRELHKGQLWINGRNLGRFWNAGPQGALYVPSSWLHAGSNDVVVFDLDAAPNRSTRGLDHEVIDLAVQPKQQ
jgi:beta-galactosidase